VGQFDSTAEVDELRYNVIHVEAEETENLSYLSERG
jgi:hypothetical protein